MTDYPILVSMLPFISIFFDKYFPQSIERYCRAGTKSIETFYIVTATRFEPTTNQFVNEHSTI